MLVPSTGKWIPVEGVANCLRRLSGTREDGRGLPWDWEMTWEEVKRHACGRKSEVGGISAGACVCARVTLF